MALINADKVGEWKADIAQSVDFYNSWFMRFAPLTYRQTRVETTKQVEEALSLTRDLIDITSAVLKANPSVLQILRMTTAPPLARDRLIGLANIQPNVVKTIEEEHRVPPKMENSILVDQLNKVCDVIHALIDRDIFPWVDSGNSPENADKFRAATIIADRLCGAVSDPLIRNEQEKRQLATIKSWLEGRGYKHITSNHDVSFQHFPPGSFSFRFNVLVKQPGRTKQVKLPIDVVVKARNQSMTSMPILIEAKSAGDYTNTNKRRKEEATKVNQLKTTYGGDIVFVLFLCGYFDSGYLGYEAAEGIDWIWEHRISDLEKLGL